MQITPLLIHSMILNFTKLVCSVIEAMRPKSVEAENIHDLYVWFEDLGKYKVRYQQSKTHGNWKFTNFLEMFNYVFGIYNFGHQD
jgi:hypothetical protein